MTDGKEIITKNEGKRTKQVMVRIPRSTAEQIDEFAGDTHSSRPDFIIDSIRQFTDYIVRETASIAVQTETTEYSREVKEAYFKEEALKRFFWEYDTYSTAKKNEPRSKEVSVLVSIPVGLLDIVNNVVEITDLFSGVQEYIKVAIYHMFRRSREFESSREALSEFRSVVEGTILLEDELQQLREEMRLRSETDRD